MLDFFLYLLVVKDYLPSVYDSLPDFHQTKITEIPDSSSQNIENYGFWEKINPVQRMADSRYGRIILIVSLVILTLLSGYISSNCYGPSKTMYVIFSLLFPVTHMIILIIPRLIYSKFGNYIGCTLRKKKKLRVSTVRI